MKVPQSDMPDEALWQSFFNAPLLMDTLVPDGPVAGDAAELGAGYGTFTQAALSAVKGTLHAYEIEPALCEVLPQRFSLAQRQRLQVHCRDVLADDTGLESNSLALVLAFNFMHFEHPQAMLRHLYEVLAPGGRLLIIHWRSDIDTPRGPDLTIRPTPQAVCDGCREAGFERIEQPDIRTSCPWHFAVVAMKK
jgi:SAM-dependent methyltransferase